MTRQLKKDGVEGRVCASPGATYSAASLSGNRLHLSEGPIDLIIWADGEAQAVRAAYRSAERRFDGLLAELCAELPLLRLPVRSDASHPHLLHPSGERELKGPIARRMAEACWPHRAVFVTPMAAVAGAVAEAVLAAMTATARLVRAYVNDGGDIALHLCRGAQFTVGLMDRPDAQGMMRTMTICADDPVRGIATSGRHGRSFSLGIADAVTVLAKTASQADAAATVARIRGRRVAANGQGGK